MPYLVRMREGMRKHLPSTSGWDLDCFGVPFHLPFMFSTRVALTDDNVQVVTVPEGVPDRVPQELTCVALDEGKFTLKGAAPSYGRELLQDSSFELIKPIKLLEINNDLVFLSREGSQQEVHY